MNLVRFDQGPLGQARRKPTGLGTNMVPEEGLVDLEGEGIERALLFASSVRSKCVERALLGVFRMPVRACFVAAAVNAYRQHFASIGGPSRAPSSCNEACHITWRPCSYPTSFQLSDLLEAFLHELLTIMGSCAEPPSTTNPRTCAVASTKARRDFCH